MFSKFTRIVAIIATVLTLQSCSKSSDSTSTPTPASPVASFNYSGANTFAPDPVTFTNTSTNALTYLWNFGDNSTSNLTSPTHTYASGGTYTVSLTATSLSGASSSTTLTINVSNAPTKVEIDTIDLYSLANTPSGTFTANVNIDDVTGNNILAAINGYTLTAPFNVALTCGNGVTSVPFYTISNIASAESYQILIYQNLHTTPLGWVLFSPNLWITVGSINYPTTIPLSYNGTNITLKVKWLP